MQAPLPKPPVPGEVALCATVLPLWARLLSTAQAQSETAVAEMMAAFAEMTPLLEAAARGQQADPTRPADDGELALLSERMLIGFQYQDRISQMLALLQDDMQRMLLAVAAKDDDDADTDALDCASWLQRLESQYAMAEQRRDHQAGEGSAAVIAAANETTFF